MAGVELRVTGAESFAALSRRLKEAGDKDLRRELFKALNRSTKPLKARVKAGLPAYVPNMYAIQLSASLKVSTRSRSSGKNPAVYLFAKAATPKGKPRDLASLNRGRLRHPLFGNRKHWYDQTVNPGWWTTPLLASAPLVRIELAKAMDSIAAKVGGTLR